MPSRHPPTCVSVCGAAPIINLEIAASQRRDAGPHSNSTPVCGTLASSGSPCFFWRGITSPALLASRPVALAGVRNDRCGPGMARGLASRGAPWAPRRACRHNYLSSRECSVWQAVKVTTHERQHEVPAPVPAMMLPIVRCILHLTSCALHLSHWCTIGARLPSAFST